MTDNDANYFDAVMAETTTGNGVCGLKMHWHQRLTMERIVRGAHSRASVQRPELALADYQAERFGHVRRVWLRRRDHVAQAISLYRASRSDFWHLGEGREVPRELDQLQYSFHDIDYLVRACFRYDTSWGKYFTDHSLPAYVIYYQELVADREGAMAKLLEFLGLPAAVASIAPARLARLSGATSRVWADCYRKDEMAWLESSDMRAA